MDPPGALLGRLGLPGATPTTITTAAAARGVGGHAVGFRGCPQPHRGGGVLKGLWSGRQLAWGVVWVRSSNSISISSGYSGRLQQAAATSAPKHTSKKVHLCRGVTAPVMMAAAAGAAGRQAQRLWLCMAAEEGGLGDAGSSAAGSASWGKNAHLQQQQGLFRQQQQLDARLPQPFACASWLSSSRDVPHHCATTCSCGLPASLHAAAEQTLHRTWDGRGSGIAQHLQ